MRPWHQMVLTLLTGLAIATAGPAFMVFLRDELQPRLATRASSVITFAHNSGEMIGPLIVGVIIAMAGADWAFAVIAVLYFAGAYFIPIVPMPEMNSDVKYAHFPYLTLLRIGLRHARRHQPIPWLIAMLVVTNLFGVAVFPLIPEYAIKVFESGGLGFGIMTGAIGGGFAIGSAIITFFNMPRRISLIAIPAILVWSAGSIAFAYSPSLLIAVAILVLMGTVSVIWSNAILNLIHTHTPYTSRTRVINIYTIAMALIPIGWAVGGAIATFTTNETALFTSAIASITLPIIAYIASPAFRKG